MRVETEIREPGVAMRHLPCEAESGPEVKKVARGEALLRAMCEGNVMILGSLVTHDVRLTSFDRGEIHEAQGREAVCEQLVLLAERAASPMVVTGSREAEDAVFLWGGSSKTERPGWMLTLFFRHARFFDVRLYLLR